MEYFDLPTFLSNIVLALVPVVGAIVIGLRTRGRSLVLGLVGCLVSALAALGFVIFQLATSGGSDLGSLVTVAPALLTFVQCAGLVLLILAIVVNRPAAAAAPPPPGYPPTGYPPGPSGYSGPWSQS